MTSVEETPDSGGGPMAGAGAGLEGGRLVITSDQSDLATARQTTAEFLRDGCDWVDLDAVLLVVSELLSNAVLHGGGWWRLVVTASARQLRIEVEDKESLVPSIRQVDMKGAPGGLGMHIISKLVTSYEAAVHPAGTGKTIRALWSRTALPNPRLAGHVGDR